MENCFHIYRIDQQYGPYSKEEIKLYLCQNHLSLNDLAWHPGAENWQPLRELMYSHHWAAAKKRAVQKTKPRKRKLNKPKRGWMRQHPYFAVTSFIMIAACIVNYFVKNQDQYAIEDLGMKLIVCSCFLCIAVQIRSIIMNKKIRIKREIERQVRLSQEIRKILRIDSETIWSSHHWVVLGKGPGNRSGHSITVMPSPGKYSSSPSRITSLGFSRR